MGVLYSQMDKLDLSTSSLAFSSAQMASTRRLFEKQQNAPRTALALATLLTRRWRAVITSTVLNLLIFPLILAHFGKQFDTEELQ